MILTDGELRLVGGYAPDMGRVEIKHAGVWGTVCADLSWGHNEASVICRQIGGYRGGRVLHNVILPMGTADTPVWLSDVSCTGLETSLDLCDRSTWAGGMCLPGNEAIVECEEEVPEEVSLGIDDIRLTDGWKGRVEIFVAGEWGTICDDHFSDREATVVCNMLGYRLGYEAATIPGRGQIWLDDISCSGLESDIADCLHSHWGQHDCTHEEDASVQCSDNEFEYL